MQTPVMMVHGMCCTGEVWSHYREFFEARGVRVFTPTLRPDLRVNVRQRAVPALGELGLDDYVRDLQLECKRIEAETGRKPAVIGHSMGGLLAQALAASDSVVAAVFISPAAPAGVRTLRMRGLWTGFKMLRALGLTRWFVKPDLRTTAVMVLNCMPRRQRRAIWESMVLESGKAFADFVHFPVDASKIHVPVLTVAATLDRLLPASLVRLTGRRYAAIGGEFREYAQHAHWLYAEPGWERPAADVFEWLERVTARHDMPSELPLRPDLRVGATTSA